MRISTFPVIVAFALGCTGDLPTTAAESDLTIVSSGGGVSCYAVRTTVQTTGVFPNFAGTTAGTLKGTVNVVLQPGSATGVVISNPGAETWEITGGEVPGLIGRQLDFEFESMTIIRPGHGPELRLNGRSRLVAGASRGNLTFHGTLDVSGFPFVADLEYHGVVCP